MEEPPQESTLTAAPAAGAGELDHGPDDPEDYPDQPGDSGQAGRPARSRWLVITAVAIVGLLVVGAFLYESGIPRSGTTSPTGPGSSASPLVDFATALGVAQNASSAQAPGPWNVVVAVGYDIHAGLGPRPLQVPSACSASGIPATPVGTATDLEAGIAPMWILLLVAPSGAVSMVAVVSGVPSILYFAAAGSPCGATSGSAGLSSTSLIDSPAFMTSLGTGIQSYLATYPTADAELVLSNDSYGAPPTGHRAYWSLQATSCADQLTAPNVTIRGESYTGIVDAVSGSVLASGQANYGPCPTSGPINSTLVLGAPVSVAASGGYNCTLPIHFLNGTVTISNLSFSLRLPNGMGDPTLAGLSVFGPGWVPIADSNTQSVGWSTGGDRTLAASDWFTLTAVSSLSGDTLTITGEGDYSGQIQLILP